MRCVRHHRSSPWITVFLACIFAAARATLATAATSSTGPAEPDEIKNPRRTLAAAQDELDAAQKELEGVVDQLRPAFESSAEFTDARSAVKQAQADREAAVAPVLARLHEQPDYQSALDARTKAAAEVEKLRSGGASAEQMTAAAKKNVEAAGAVQSLETMAINADPAARAASAKLADATAKLSALQQRFKDSIKNSPEFAKAKEKVEHARIKRDKASVALNNLLRRQQEAKEARERASAARHPKRHK